MTKAVEPAYPLGVEWWSPDLSSVANAVDSILVDDFFIGRDGTHIQRINIENGSVMWRRSAGTTEIIWDPEEGFHQIFHYTSTRDPIIVNEDKFYQRITGDILVCDSLPDCERLWTGPSGVKEFIQVGNQIILRTDDELKALDEYTGATIWSRELLYHLTSDDDYIYGINYNILEAYHPNGTQAWNYDFGFVLNWVAKPKLVNDNYLFLYTTNGTIGFNLETREKTWYSLYNGDLYSAADNLIIDGDWPELLVSVNQKTGQLAWNISTRMNVECIVDNILICKNQRTLYYVNATSGDIKYQLTFDNGIREINHHEGKLYVTAYDYSANRYKYGHLKYMEPITIDTIIPPILHTTNPYTNTTTKITITGKTENPNSTLEIYREDILLNTTTTNQIGNYKAEITIPDPKSGNYTIKIKDPYHVQTIQTNYTMIPPDPPTELKNRIIHHLSEIPNLIQNTTLLINPSTSNNKPLNCQPANPTDLNTQTYFEHRIPNLIKTLDDNNSNIKFDGSLKTDPSLFTIGISGPLVNPVVKYYESSLTELLDRSQIETLIDPRGTVNAHIEARRLNGEMIESTSRLMSYIGPGYEEDLFIVEIFEDSEGRIVLVMYGFGPMGTMASGFYLENVILEDPSSFESAWVIVSWNDTNQNNQVDPPDNGDTYTIVTSGENFWN